MAITQSTLDTLLTAAQGATRATGTITVTTVVPTEGDTLTINGTVYTFKASASLPTEISIGGSLSACAANIAAALNANAFADINKTGLAHYSANTSAVTVTHNAAGTVGNNFTLATSNSTNLVLSGSKLTGGANGTATVFDSNAISGGTISAKRLDSAFEANVVALLAAFDFLVKSTVDPSVDQTHHVAARQQRKVLKQILRCLDESVKTVANSGHDDRSSIADSARTKAVSVYNRLPRPDDL